MTCIASIAPQLLVICACVGYVLGYELNRRAHK